MGWDWSGKSMTVTPATSEMLVCVERVRHDEWLARFEKDPNVRFVGNSAEAAFEGLLDQHRELLPENCGRVEINSDYHRGHLQFLLFPRYLCRDCSGRGKYIGLIHVEPCQTCGGTGLVVS